MDDEPLFSELVEYGRAARKGYWLAMGRQAARTGAPSSAFNYWIAFMKNEFGWSEKAEVKDITDQQKLTTDDIKKRIASLSKKIHNLPAPEHLAQLMTEDNEQLRVGS